MLRNKTKTSKLPDATTTNISDDPKVKNRFATIKILSRSASLVILGTLLFSQISAPAIQSIGTSQQKLTTQYIVSNSTESTSNQKRRKKRLAIAPPGSRKLFCAVSKWPVSEAFLLKKFKLIRDCKVAAFFNLCFSALVKLKNSDLRPWNRPNWLPGTYWIDDKRLFLQGMKQYKQVSGGHDFSFVPEAYQLDDASDRMAFLERLQEKGGMDKAWVFKNAALDGRSKGVSFVGPRSQQLQSWREGLQQGGKIDHKSKHIVQKYVENLLTYHGHKFNIRSFFIIASANPPLVYYYDGYLRVSPIVFNETHFGNDADDPRNMHSSSNLWKKKEDISDEEKRMSWAGFDDFSRFLRLYIANEAPHLRHVLDPPSHIRNQMKEAGAQVFAAFRDHCFNMTDFPVDNAYEIIGADFFVDKNLHVWMIELNKYAGLYAESEVMKKVVNKMLPEMVDVLSEIYEKQLHGDDIWPLKSVDISDPVYSDDFEYSYDDNPTKPNAK